MKTAYRANILHFHAEPDINNKELDHKPFDVNDAYTYLENGLLVIENGRVLDVGPSDQLLAQHADAKLVDYSGHLLLPGFIDPHIHYPQVEIIASYGEKLLDWLNNYTFPAEQKFADPNYASTMADFFLRELLRNGTTTAMVYGTVHKQSVEAFFEASDQLNTRMICGKVMMDRHAPDYLCDTPASSYNDSKALIDKWHGKGRQLYAVTPRFAITSSPEQLEKAGRLLREHPDVYMQTHISENKDEVAFVNKYYPERKDYLDVYDHYGLLGERSVFAHGIHLNAREHQRLHETGSSIAFCPTSNLFLGSGLLDIATLEKANVNYSVATDVGAGTSFSMLQTLHEAYKVAHLQGKALCPLKSLYLATLGNAKALRLEDKIGSFNISNEADFVVVDLACTPIMALKQNKANTLMEKLFSLIVLGDDRAVKATYIAGALVHDRDKTLDREQAPDQDEAH